MTSTLTIGDFSRATHLSAKMLRHYHEVGLLEPAEVDVDSGYRRYAAEQIVTAQIIRRFRDLEMPLEDIHVVLQARRGSPISCGSSRTCWPGPSRPLHSTPPSSRQLSWRRLRSGQPPR